MVFCSVKLPHRFIPQSRTNVSRKYGSLGCPTRLGSRALSASPRRGMNVPGNHPCRGDFTVPEPLRCVAPETVITGWDFSTGSVKGLAFDLDGNALAEVRLPTDLWTEGGVSE